VPTPPTTVAAPMAYSEHVTWVKAHPGWTILVALGIIVALYAFSYVMFNVGGGSVPGSGEGDIIQTVESAILGG
jgi:hypothetical protein